MIRLHVGEPYFSPPEQAIEALVASARERRTSYTSAEGLIELREALVEKLETHNGHRTGPDKVFVTPGSCQGLAAVMQSIANPGDELLLPELHWPIHLQQCLLAGFRPLFYRLRQDFTPDVSSLVDLATDRTTAILVNSPANPTGAVLDKQVLVTILELAQKQGWHVISDEAYEDFVYDGDHVSMASLESELSESRRRVFSSFSFSKSFAMTGYRLGYVTTPNSVRADALRVVQEASIVAPSTPVQYAGLAALGARDSIPGNRAAVLRGRDLAMPVLSRAGLLHKAPAGGWYAMLDVRSSSLDGEALATRLLSEKNVALAPATGFALRPTVSPGGMIDGVAHDPAAEHLVRLAFCGQADLLVEGVRRIVDFVANGS